MLTLTNSPIPSIRTLFISKSDRFSILLFDLIQYWVHYSCSILSDMGTHFVSNSVQSGHTLFMSNSDSAYSIGVQPIPLFKFIEYSGILLVSDSTQWSHSVQFGYPTRVQFYPRVQFWSVWAPYSYSIMSDSSIGPILFSMGTSFVSDSRPNDQFCSIWAH